MGRDRRHPTVDRGQPVEHQHNTPPTAADDWETTELNTAVVVSPLGNDYDSNGDTLTITAKTNGAHGTVAYASSTVTYTPNSNWSGDDTFTYTISDGNGGTATTTAHLTVFPLGQRASTVIFCLIALTIQYSSTPNRRYSGGLSS